VTAETVRVRLLKAAGLALWGVIILAPLVILFREALAPATKVESAERVWNLMLRSFGLAGIIAGAAVLLGWAPGRLLGGCRRCQDVLLLLLLMPLVLPRYVLYYAWGLLLSPTSELGRYLGERAELAQFVGTFTSSAVLVLWYWPLAALLIGQGWRNTDREVWNSARLDAGRWGLFRKITLPLLGRTVVLAFGVCFVLSLSEFSTFHLAGIETVGTELAVLYELTGSAGCLARAAWPIAAAAVVVAIALGWHTRRWGGGRVTEETAKLDGKAWRWVTLSVLLGFSLAAPLALLIASIDGTQAFEQFLRLHVDELGWSLAIAAVGAVMAQVMAMGILSLKRRGRIGRWFCLLTQSTIFLAMLVPASLMAVSLLKMLAGCRLPPGVREGWYIVSAGQASRFAGVALILQLLMRHAQETSLGEMAALDGASRLKTWWHVHLPRTWGLFAGGLILIVMFGAAELPATMVLLPAGLPNFAQRLLNQMHYARDQQVIASCLALAGAFLVLTTMLVLLWRAIRGRRAALVIMAAFLVGMSGCDAESGTGNGPKIVAMFGRTGRGGGEFMYPRAIDIARDGSVSIVDKTARIQRFSAAGDLLGVLQMPLAEMGKPTGLSFAANGDLYVADTHYHRVMVFSSAGKIIGEFGQFGEDEGCFIYPTDVAFSGEGRIFVSEYGGNDRVSVFGGAGEFLYCFGEPGSGRGEFSRPAALGVDRSRGLLYVADACNHRIAIYDFDGTVVGYIGSAGRGRGQLRYPYDLAVTTDNNILVCEYGNNRIQLFSPEGQSLGVYGRAGRGSGELAYPWGVAVDGQGRAFIVDAGNNRIQVWQL